MVQSATKPAPKPIPNAAVKGMLTRISRRI